MKKIAPRTAATILMITIRRLISALSKDGGRLMEVVDFAIDPKKVTSPVEKTIAVPFPKNKKKNK